MFERWRASWRRSGRGRAAFCLTLLVSMVSGARPGVARPGVARPGVTEPRAAQNSPDYLVQIGAFEGALITDLAVFEELIAVGSPAALALYRRVPGAAPEPLVVLPARASALALVGAGDELAFVSSRGRGTAIVPIRSVALELQESGFFTPTSSERIEALATDDRGLLYEALADGELRVTDPATGTTTPLGHLGTPLTALAVDGSGQQIASGDRAGAVRLETPGEGLVLGTFEGPIRKLLWSPGARPRLLVVPADGAAGWFDPGGRFHPLPGRITAATWSPDGRLVALGSEEGGIDLWVPSGGRIASWQAHEAPVTALTWEGSFLLSGDEDGLVRLWAEPEEGQAGLVAKEEIRPAFCCVVDAASDGNQWLFAHRDGTLRLWDGGSERPTVLLAGRERLRAVALGPRGWVAWATEEGALHLGRRGIDLLVTEATAEPGLLAERLRFSPDGESLWLAPLGERRLLRFSVPELAAEGEILAGDDPVTALAVGPGGGSLAWGDSRGAIGIGSAEPWDRRRHQLERVTDLAWSPDGRWLATGAGGKALLWSTEGPPESRTLSLSAVCESRLPWDTHVAFAPSGGLLFCASDELRSFDLTTLRPGPGHRLGPDRAARRLFLAGPGLRLLVVTDRGLEAWQLRKASP